MIADAVGCAEDHIEGGGIYMSCGTLSVPYCEMRACLPWSMVVPCSGALLLVILAAVRGLSEAHCSLMTHRGNWMWSHICCSWGVALLCVVCCVAVGGLLCRGGGFDFVFVFVGVFELI